jgi:hypothetical protein
MDTGRLQRVGAERAYSAYVGSMRSDAYKHDGRGLGRSGPNLEPGTVRVYVINGLIHGLNTTEHPPSPGYRAGPDLPTNVQAVSRAVSYVNTHRPRSQVRVNPTFLARTRCFPTGSLPQATHSCTPPLPHWKPLDLPRVEGALQLLINRYS